MKTLELIASILMGMLAVVFGLAVFITLVTEKPKKKSRLDYVCNELNDLETDHYELRDKVNAVEAKLLLIQAIPAPGGPGVGKVE